jgi:hypothetical protein
MFCERRAGMEAAALMPLHDSGHSGVTSRAANNTALAAAPPYDSRQHRTGEGARATERHMTELITVEQAESVLRALIWMGPLVGALVGLITGAIRRCPVVGLWQGVAVGLLGPVVYGAWLLYDYMVRYNPETGEAGLHKVWVHAVNALIFVVLGVALGAIYRRFVFPECSAEDGADPETSEQ